MTPVEKCNNCSKHCFVQVKIVVKRGYQNGPIFQPLVHRLLPILHPLMHVSIPTFAPNSFGTFCNSSAIPRYPTSVSHLSPYSNIHTTHLRKSFRCSNPRSCTAHSATLLKYICTLYGIYAWGHDTFKISVTGIG